MAATAGAGGGEVEVLDSRRLGAAWTLDRIWERLGVGAAIRRVAAGRRRDGDAVERVVFALVAQRACEPGSKLAATGWVAERVAIGGCAGFTDDAAYAAMDFLLDALDEIAAEIFSSVAHLLNLDLDIVFVDTTSTYWETETADDDHRTRRPGRRRRAAQPDRGGDPGVRALQGPPRRSAAGGDRDGGHPRRSAGAVLDLPRRHRRHRDHPHRQRRPGRLGVAPAGVGGRSRVRLRGESGLPDPRRRALHPRREAAPHQHRGGRSAGPPRALPHRRRQPAGQGGPRRPGRGRRRRRATTGPAPNGS